MEEGGGREIAELERRLQAWDVRGRKRLEDLASFHVAIDLPHHFAAPFPLQRTWSPLCRTLLAWRGEAIDPKRLRQVQCTELGAGDGAGALLELLPLPARGTSAWPYASLHVRRADLSSRERYTDAVTPLRIAMLRALIEQGRPRVVVFYGRANLAAWASIAGSELRPYEINGRRCFVSERTISYGIAVPHPVARGMTSAFWQALGMHLREVTG
jgi:hypothetical protein